LVETALKEGRIRKGNPNTQPCGPKGPILWIRELSRNRVDLEKGNPQVEKSPRPRDTNGWKEGDAMKWRRFGIHLGSFCEQLDRKGLWYTNRK